MIFPKYQWIFNDRFESDFTETSFNYGGKYYSCTEKDISTSIYGSIDYVLNLHHKTINLDSLGNVLEYREGYEKQRNLYVNEYNVSSMPVEWARGIYDAV